MPESKDGRTITPLSARQTIDRIREKNEKDFCSEFEIALIHLDNAGVDPDLACRLIRIAKGIEKI